MEHKLEIEIHLKEKSENNDYRLYINNELFLERPYILPSNIYSHQVVHTACILQKGSNTINLENINGNLVLGTININNKEIKHTNGYFEL